MSAEIEAVDFGPAVKLSQGIHALVDTPIEFNPDGIPEEMKPLKQWVCWSKIKATEDGAPTKKPTKVTDGVLHGVEWGKAINRYTFDDALAEFKRYPEQYHGVGFIFEPDDPYVIIDVDYLEEDDEIFTDIDGLDSYIETSQSGKGLHIIVKAKFNGQLKTPAIEIYGNRRFLAMTGANFRDYPSHITEAQQFVDDLAEAYADDEPKEPGSTKPNGAGGLDISNAIQGIISGAELHDNINRVAGHLAQAGGKQGAVEDVLYGFMQQAMPNVDPARWEDRNADIPRAVKSAIDKFGAKRRKQPAGRFALMPYADVRAKMGPINWCVNRFIPMSSIVELFGPPKQFKTFITVSIACCIATGRKWHGQAVEQGLVVYVAGEGQEYLSRRMEAWLIENNVNPDEMDMVVSNRSTAMTDIERVQELIECIRDTGREPRLVVLDTLARNFGSGDENSTQHMNELVVNTEEIMLAFPKATVMFIHHTGHGDVTRGRGSSVLFGAVDTAMRVSYDNKLHQIKMDCAGMKEAAPFDPQFYAHKEIELGFKEHDGSEATSLVLRPAQGSAARSELIQAHPELFSGKRAQRIGPVMGYLFDNAGCSIRAVGVDLAIDKGAVARIVEMLRALNWVEREKLILTEQGVHMLRLVSDNPKYVLAGLGL